MSLSRHLLFGLAGAAFASMAIPCEAMDAGTQEAALQCDSPDMNTPQRTECWEKRAALEISRMQKSYRRAIAAAKAMATDGGFPDLSPEIKTAQGHWKNFEKAQCDLESDATLGSAAGIAGSVCSERLTHERAESLDALADGFEMMASK